MSRGIWSRLSRSGINTQGTKQWWMRAWRVDLVIDDSAIIEDDVAADTCALMPWPEPRLKVA